MKKLFKSLSIILITALLFFTSENILNAASATITVSSNTSQIVLGKEFTVTVKLSSSSVLGSWEWLIDYDTSKFKLVSGTSFVVDFGDSKSKSKSYTYKFKSIGTGTGKISVKSASALAWDESKFSLSIGSKSIKVITQQQLESSYSKNNDLKSLSINNLTLSPTFNASTLEYTAQAESNVTVVTINATKSDSKASVSGTGEKSVSEGDNIFEVTVTAQNGSTKTYKITVTVTDPNPIEIIAENGEKLTVVKRESNLERPENYESTKIIINDSEVPAFYNELNDITLVGLKNENAEIKLFIYNKENNTYEEYNEVSLDKLTIMPLSIEDDFKTKYKKDKITINDSIFEALIMTNNNYAIIHAQNLLDGSQNYYIYDKKLNTIITFDDSEEKLYEAKLSKYFNIIILLCAESLLIFLILIIILINKSRKNKKRKQKILEAKKKEQETIQTEDKQNNNKEEKETTKEKKKTKKNKMTN